MKNFIISHRLWLSFSLLIALVGQSLLKFASQATTYGLAQLFPLPFILIPLGLIYAFIQYQHRQQRFVFTMLFITYVQMITMFYASINNSDGYSISILGHAWRLTFAYSLGAAIIYIYAKLLDWTFDRLSIKAIE